MTSGWRAHLYKSERIVEKARDGPVRTGRVGVTIRIVVLAVACGGWTGMDASAALGVAVAQRIADSPASLVHQSAGASRAPTGAPLISPSTEAKIGGETGTSSSALSSAGDPLVSNGLGSPMCHDVEAVLSRTSQNNCRTSGFEAAPAPTGNYAFDVHINTGIAKWDNDAAAMFQNLIQLGWTVLVAAVHGLIVMIEWCYTLDLLNSAAMRGVAAGLRETQAVFTQPWLVAVLAVASVLALYHGLVRRRVAETVGQALLMLAMMAGGLWVIMDPTGTVGSLGEWANQAGVGALGAVAGGTPDHPDRTLADTMRDVFAGAVGGPWCFMEFGNVGWCNNAARLDPRLRAAAMALAAQEGSQIGCGSTIGSPIACAQRGSEQPRLPSQSVEQLHNARTNGELFLALPANQAMRNSINDPRSLFNVLCGGSETPCRGPTAAEAEFRTEHGTEWRFMGLVFIWVGALGMLLLLGFIAMHLLGAAIASLLYLLLAPVAVLAPALGDGGRTAFRGWATRLAAAVMAKLIYSFLLGVVLLMDQILTVDLTALGWFTQWLLISTMWWGVFCHRHHVLDLAQVGPGPRGERKSIARRVSGALETPSAVLRGAELAKRRLSKPSPTVESGRRRSEAVYQRTSSGAAGQVGRTLERGLGDAAVPVQEASEIQEWLSAKRAQLQRVRGEQSKALASGDARRAAELKYRAERIEGEIGRSQQRLNAARGTVSDGQRGRRAGGVFTRAQARDGERFLDAQAALPAGIRARSPGTSERRDYGALASLAGYGRGEYERLDPVGRRAARLEVDRELALRRELNATAGVFAADGGVPTGRRGRRTAANELDERMRRGGHPMPRSRADSTLQWRRDGRTDRQSRPATESKVMRDVREVAERRKRQLGTDSER